MTSNSEKGLPDPFLRRVAFFDIKFPGEEDLLDIMKNKLEHFDQLDAKAVVGLFEKIRKAELGVLNKKPATAELLHWSSALLQLGIFTSNLNQLSGMTTEQKKLLGYSLSVLAKTRNDLDTLKKAIGLDV